jgi:hypothetical protein
MKRMLIAFLAMSLSACGEKEEDPKLTLKGAGTSTGNVVAATGVDAAELQVKVYELHISKNADCTDPKKVFALDDSGATYVNFLAGPTLGDGEVDQGDYPCVMIVMADNIKFKPQTTTGACEKDKEYVLDVCRETSHTMFDGTTGACKEGEDKVTLYLSTVSKSVAGSQETLPDSCKESLEAYQTNCNTFSAPSETYPYRGIKLGAQLTVKKETSSTFVVDGTGKVSSRTDYGPNGTTTTTCDMDPPAFSFE